MRKTKEYYSKLPRCAFHPTRAGTRTYTRDGATYAMCAACFRKYTHLDIRDAELDAEAPIEPDAWAEST